MQDLKHEHDDPKLKHRIHWCLQHDAWSAFSYRRFKTSRKDWVQHYSANFPMMMYVLRVVHIIQVLS